MSSAEEELRTRLIELDNEIDAQKTVLLNLEHEKCLVQRRLNAVLDPITRLPLEISSLIFMMLQPRDPFPIPRPNKMPMVLLNVCNSWSNIALSIPALWTTFAILFPCAKGLKDLLPVWLERTRGQPLSVCLDGVFDHDVVDIIWKHGKQLKYLEIWAEDRIKKKAGADDSRVMRFWEKMPPEDLSSLKVLKLCGSSWDRTLPFSIRHIVELMNLAPNLNDCFLQEVRLADDGCRAGLVHSKLRRLSFRRGNGPGGDNGLVHYLSLPALEVLCMPDRLSTSEWDVFVEESSPPLRELELLASHSDFAFFKKCFEATPDLERFEVWSAKYPVLEEMFEALMLSPDLLPNLSTLVIHLPNIELFNMSNSFWKKLSTALAIRRRRTGIREFHCDSTFELPPSKMPGLGILDALKELRRDGMKIQLNIGAA
ncbi:F-box domain-containing protein [Favolaschia claudopus]|uniref:F-box domain-containing protein n=1 Tax=Favolaschia claudopus TaxID=2862362 RepID=A0AAW0BP93_9AGAR